MNNLVFDMNRVIRVLAIAVALLPTAAASATLSVLTQFVRNDFTYVARDGAFPYGPVVIHNGNLFGTTFAGGAGCKIDEYNSGCGTIFRLEPPGSGSTQWKRTVLHRFTGGQDGFRPNGHLVVAGDGTIYGTTYTGGIGCKVDVVEFFGCGTIFRLTPPASGQNEWKKKALHYFRGRSDGEDPGSLVIGEGGSLYGTATASGPTCGSGSDRRCGTIFRLSPPLPGQTTWTKTVVYTFKGGSDGGSPRDLIFRNGALYGTASGGLNNKHCPNGCGVIFRLTSEGGDRPWKKVTLYSFTGAADAESPYNLKFSKSGVLFGVATIQGKYGSVCYYQSCTHIFSLQRPTSGQPRWTKSVLKSFTGDSSPDFVFGKDGAIYGFMAGGDWYEGKAFKLTLEGQLTTLYNFSVNAPLRDQQYPVFDRNGTLFGSNPGGSRNGDGGSIFKLVP